MFQVAPMIAARDRRQPIIGNTVVSIIFQDGGSFDPSCITSQVLRTGDPFTDCSLCAFDQHCRVRADVVDQR